MKLKRNRKAQEGFTLVELMVVVAIIALCGAIATPVLLAELPNYRLRGTARAISSALQYAKMSAASIGKEYKVEFLLDTSPQTYRFQQGSRFSRSEFWKEVEGRREIGRQVRIRRMTDYKGSHSEGAGVIVFNPTGTASSGGIYLENSKGKQCAVKVSSTTGRIRIDDKW